VGFYVAPLSLIHKGPRKTQIFPSLVPEETYFKSPLRGKQENLLQIKPRSASCADVWPTELIISLDIQTRLLRTTGVACFTSVFFPSNPYEIQHDRPGASCGRQLCGQK
jgi:hypothetical protein